MSKQVLDYLETTIGEVLDLEIKMYEHHRAPGPDGRKEGWLTARKAHQPRSIPGQCEGGDGRRQGGTVGSWECFGHRGRRGELLALPARDAQARQKVAFLRGGTGPPYRHRREFQE